MPVTLLPNGSKSWDRVTWAAKHGVELRFIQPGKPVQSAYIESFYSPFRDECLSQQWFASLSHMHSLIDKRRDDYNHHRPHSPPPVHAAGRVRRALPPAPDSICRE